MKVSFANPHLEYLGAGKWRVDQNYPVTVDDETFVVPKGFKTDLDSIPRLPLTYWLVKGRAIKSAVIHDYLYSLQRPREWCDAVMYAAMEVEGVRPIFRKLIWAGVRAGGWAGYGRKIKRKAVPLEEVPPP